MAGSNWPQKTFDRDARDLSNHLQVNEIGPDEAPQTSPLFGPKQFKYPKNQSFVKWKMNLYFLDLTEFG